VNIFLAIDYGDRRIGMAVGYADVAMAFPRTTIDRKQNPDYISGILEQIKKEKADALVVGMPYHPQGLPVDKTVDVKAFIKELQQHTDLPLYTQDEAFSSEEAKRRTAHYKKSKKKQKGLVDQAAAAVFLQEFLNNWAI
jgi:putative Holliday junction resolvase